MAQDITYAYVGGLTAKRGEDGFLRVKGLATDATLDLDEQICDPDWLKNAMPKWMEIGNIREMHQSKAVGKAIEMEQTGTGFAVEAKVVDKEAATKVEEGVYTGYSIGIKGARVVKDAAAPGGRIVDGQIVEVSLVDRPANPSAKIEIAKTIKGQLVKGAAVADLEKELVTEATFTEPVGTSDEVLQHEETQVCTACAGTGYKTNVEGNLMETPCEVCSGTGKQPEGQVDDILQNSPTIPQDMDNRDMKEADADVEKKDYSEEQRASMAESGQAMEGGGFPIKTVKDLKNAIQAIGRAKNRAETIAHIKTRAEALGRTDLIPEEWKTVAHDETDLNAVRASLIALIKAELDEMLASDENEICDVQELLCSLSIFLDWWTDEAAEGETTEPFHDWDADKEPDMAYIGLGVSADLIKTASAESATDADRDALRSEIVKALGLTETITKAELAEAKEEIALLKAELSSVKEMAAPASAVLRATNEQTAKSAQVTMLEVEAERRRYMASQVTDPELRRQYLDSATRLEAQAKQF